MILTDLTYTSSFLNQSCLYLGGEQAFELLPSYILGAAAWDGG